MLMNADEFDDDFGDPRSMRSGIAGLDLESSGEAKESKSPLDRPSRGRHSRKKKMAPPSMAPPQMKPPSMAPPRDVYGESKEEEKSSGFGSAGALGESTQSRARALAKQRQIQMQRRQQALQASTMSRGAAHMSSEGHTFTPGVAQFSAPRAQKNVQEYGAFGRSRRDDFNDEPDPAWGSRKNQEKDYSARNVSREERQFGERFAPVSRDDMASPYRSRRDEGEEEPPPRRERVYRDDDDRYNRPVQEARERERRRDYDDRQYDEPSPKHYDEPSPSRDHRSSYDDRRRYDEEDEYFDRRRREEPSRSRRDDYDYDDRDRRRYDDEEPSRSRRDDYDDYDRRERRRESPPPRERERERRRDDSPPPRRERDRRDYSDDDGYDSPPRRRSDDSPPRGSPEPREPRDEKKTRRRKKERSPSPEPEEYEDERGPSPASETPSAPEFDASALDLRDMRKFLTTACPRRAGVVQCSIKRNRSGTNKLFPEYAVYMKEGDRFLMCSKKRPNNKTSNYLISMGEGDLKRNSKNYIGKLRANFAGTEFQVFDSGANPSLIDTGSSERCELGAVVYTANVLGSRGPRKMQAAVPKLDRDGKSRSIDVLAKLKAQDKNDITYTINKPPRWNDQVGAYVLNFNGRVTMASVKNFQLVEPDEQDAVLLQFGRVGKDEFTMDFRYPLTPFQAFAITLSSFDSKIACD